MSAPVSTKKKRTPNLDVEDGIEYPSSDGKPMGETGTHARVAMWTIWGALYLYFFREPKVAVHGNMFVYYVKGDPKKCVCPDAFVALGAENNPDRRSYKVWKEGKAPDVVFEVTSKKTRKQDLGNKFEIYRDVLKVQEYFLFDPFEEYLDPSLQGYRLVGGRYEPIPLVPGGLTSEVLGFGLQRRGEELRFYNHQTGKLLPLGNELEMELKIEAIALREAELALREAEVARREDQMARREMELDNERLRREIEDLRRRQAEGQG
jgi:Uma2 family endonuclease